jgi:uncharacterized lipoprotein YehR (DUF1307 family)
MNQKAHTIVATETICMDPDVNGGDTIAVIETDRELRELQSLIIAGRATVALTASKGDFAKQFDVSVGGEVVASAKTNHSLMQVLIMLQKKQAHIEGENASGKSDDTPIAFQSVIKAAKLPKAAFEALTKAGINTKSEAIKFLIANGNTFAGIEGLTDTSIAKLNGMFGS